MFLRARISKLCVFKNLVKYESSDSQNKKRPLIKVLSVQCDGTEIFQVAEYWKATSKQIYSKCFFDSEVQELLKKITNVDFEKVFEPKGRGKKLTTPRYKLLTTEELNVEMEKAERTANYLLQIPPLVDIEEKPSEILEKNLSLDGHDDEYCKVVFTDISFNILDEERVVVVREPNGILRTATRNEQFRMNQIYFPKPGRNMETPEMFQEEYLKEVIDREDYIFILDRACAQFEPYDADYHKVIERTYEAINDKSHFEKLHSTRHFGSLVFYLVTHKKIDNLLIENINSKRIGDACALIKVYHIVHPNCESAKIAEKKSEIDIIKDFIELDSNKKDVLQLTLQTYKNNSENINVSPLQLEKSHRIGES